MKKSIKFLQYLFIAVFCVALVGCDDEDGNPNPPEASIIGTWYGGGDTSYIYLNFTADDNKWESYWIDGQNVDRGFFENNEEESLLTLTSSITGKIFILDYELGVKNGNEALTLMIGDEDYNAELDNDDENEIISETFYRTRK